MKFDCKIKVKHNFSKINSIIKNLPQIAEEITQDVLENIRAYAIKLEKGHNSDGILVEMIDTSTMKIKGRIYTSKEKFPWAMFEHYGTGDYRELGAVGITKHFIETGGSQWFIPVAKAEKELHYPIIDIQGSKFYVAHGVKANHFMTDAEFESREENKEKVKEKLENMLKEICK